MGQQRGHDLAGGVRAGNARRAGRCLGFVLALIAAGRLAGGAPAARRLTSVALLATCGAPTIGAALYLKDMFLREKKLCPYCLTTAAASFTLMGLSLPELRSTG